MRKIYTLLSFITITVANAQYESFSYTTPLEDNGWIKHTGNAVLTPIITASDNGNSLSFNGLPKSLGNRIALTPTENVAVNKAFPIPSTTVVYTSFLMKVTDISSIPANTATTAPVAYFFNFSTNQGADVSDTGSPSRIGIRKGSIDNTFNISLLNTTGGAVATTEIYGVNPKDYNINQTYFVVVKYDMTGEKGKSSIWINTLSENEILHSSEAGTSTKQQQISSIVLRQRKSAAPGVELDEIRYGTTWKEVTESTLAIDEVVNKNKNILSNTFVIDQFKVLSNQKTIVDIYSLNGQLIKTVRVSPQNSVNISNLPHGVYIIKVVEGNQTYTQKIVKK